MMAPDERRNGHQQYFNECGEPRQVFVQQMLERLERVAQAKAADFYLTVYPHCPLALSLLGFHAPFSKLVKCVSIRVGAAVAGKQIVCEK